MKYKILILAMFLLAFFFVGYLIFSAIQVTSEEINHNRNEVGTLDA